MTNFSTDFILHGTDEPSPPRYSLRAGPLTAVLENGTLRYLKLGDLEVVRGLYTTVRDKNWGTVEPWFTCYEVEQDETSFRVRLAAEHESDEIHFLWDGEISGSEDGTIRFTMDGTAGRTFLKNRIGFCILHPMELAGTPVEVRSPDSVSRGSFPQEISPHQPFSDITAMRYSAGPGAEVELILEGDLFEMEDQRNWTDASYKTYCTPLRFPFPVEIRAGERVTQSVTIRALGMPKAKPAGSDSREPEIVVKAEPVGILPPLGFGVASHGETLTETELEHLRALKPAHLRVGLDLTGPGWAETLRRATAETGALGADLELEVITDDTGLGLDALIEALSQERSSITRLLVFSGLVTARPVLQRVRRLMEAAGIEALVGGGSRSSFAEFNRAELPLDLMKVAGYPMNPQVHAFDDASIIETLAAQAATVGSAQKIVGALPLAIGPITLKMPFNPAATGPEGGPKPGELPPEVDPRQMSLFCAGWTIGSIRHLACAGAASLTYYETTGWRGVMEKASGPPLPERFPSRPGTLFPVYHIFADLAGFTGAEVLSLKTGELPGVEALAVRAAGRLRLLVANLEGESRRPTVSVPMARDLEIRVLDSASAATAGTNGFRPWIASEREEGVVQLDLPPYAVVALSGATDQVQKGAP